MPDDGKHLFVLIHGLWGSYSHMKSIEKVYSENFGESNNAIFFMPRQNAKFKTFDGIEIIGYRALIELCVFIKDYRKEHPDGKDRITKISVLGYSLGGLVARFVVGKCFTDCKEIFEGIEPTLFITLASPHLGIEFYNRNSVWRSWFLNPFLKALGSTFLGKSGRELFLTNNIVKNNTLVKLSEKEFLYALSLFKHRIVGANVKNDRTVAFYTAFITDHDPFIETNNSIKYFFEEEIPDDNQYESTVLPRIVDLNKLDKNALAPRRKQKISLKRKILFPIVLTLAFVIFFPISLILNACGTVYSYVTTVKYQRILDRNEFPDIVKEKIGLTDQLKKYVSETYESILNERSNDKNFENADSNDLAPFTTNVSATAVPSQNELWNTLIDKYSNITDSHQSWMKSFNALPFDESRKIILKNLSTLKWIRIPFYIKTLNAHAGIVARRGIKDNTPPTSLSALEFQANLIKYLLSTDDVSSA